MVVNEITVNDYLTKSNLPDSDYVINPYVGCTHGCKYCYASFMKRFTGHKENWGDFIDIKRCNKPIDLRKISGKNIFLSSVTDCYNQYEKDFCITRNILEQLVDSDCNLTISTKSKLILRDIDLLKQIKNLIVCMSINTLNEKFRSDMDKALRPALMKVGEDVNVIPVRGPKEFINGEYRYTFEIRGDINCFNGIESVYKNDVKIYELRCTGGLIK